MSEPCRKEKIAFNTAKRDVENIRKQQRENIAEAEKSIKEMIKHKRPSEMIELARKLIKMDSWDEVNDYQSDAAEYYMPPNNFGEMVTLYNQALKRAGAIDRYLKAREYEKKCRQALDECMKKQKSKRCGKPTTKGRPCMQRLGPDGICQFHG